MPQCPESRPTGDLATDPAAQKEYEMLKVLAEHYFGSMMVVDAAGRFVYANPGCSKLLDIDHDTLMRISIYDTLQDYCCSSSASIAPRKRSGSLSPGIRRVTPLFSSLSQKTA